MDWQQNTEPRVPWVVSILRASNASGKSASCFPEVSRVCTIYMTTAPGDMSFALMLVVLVYM